MRASALLGVSALALATACSSDPAVDASPDGGASDGFVRPDVGPFDAGFPYDSGSRTEDVGFADPATLQEGIERIDGVNMYLHVRGTTTSTMPAIIVLSSGPMLGNEYLVEPLDFLLGPGGREDPDRLLVFFDMRATGRSGFGPVGNSSITVDSHVLDLSNVIDFMEERYGVSTPVDFVGHGYGAGIAVLYAAAHPQEVNRMVLVAPFPSNVREYVDWTTTWNARLSTPDRERLYEITMYRECLRDLERCSRESWNIIGPTWFCRDTRSIFPEMSFDYVNMRNFNPQYGYVAVDLREKQYDWSVAMSRVRAETTIVSGDCDPIPARSALVYTSSIAGAVHTAIPTSGHFPMTEAPSVFQSVVRRALTYP